VRFPVILRPLLIVAALLFAGAGTASQASDAQSPLVYVSDVTSSVVDIFDVHGRKVGEITTGLSAPVGLFVDKKHRLWVANGGANNVLVFPRGAKAPTLTLTQRRDYQPNDVAMCPDGTVVVANSFNAGGIAVYPPGHAMPARYLQAELSGAGGDEYFVTCDASGNVFANGFIGLSPVAATTGWLGGRQSGYVFLSYNYTGGIKATPSGTLLTNGYVNSKDVVVEITEAGALTGSLTYTSPDLWADIAINRSASVVFGADPSTHEGRSLGFPNGRTGNVYASSNLVAPEGIAFDPGG
jgi:DNA-binding beta-propeller fold protein YncE